MRCESCQNSPVKPSLTLAKGGHTPEDFVRQINEEYAKLNN